MLYEQGSELLSRFSTHSNIKTIKTCNIKISPRKNGIQQH